MSWSLFSCLFLWWRFALWPQFSGRYKKSCWLSVCSAFFLLWGHPILSQTHSRFATALQWNSICQSPQGPQHWLLQLLQLTVLDVFAAYDTVDYSFPQTWLGFQDTTHSWFSYLTGHCLSLLVLPHLLDFLASGVTQEASGVTQDSVLEPFPTYNSLPW